MSCSMCCMCCFVVFNIVQWSLLHVSFVMHAVNPWEGSQPLWSDENPEHEGGQWQSWDVPRTTLGCRSSPCSHNHLVSKSNSKYRVIALFRVFGCFPGKYSWHVLTKQPMQAPVGRARDTLQGQAFLSDTLQGQAFLGRCRNAGNARGRCRQSQLHDSRAPTAGPEASDVDETRSFLGQWRQGYSGYTVAIQWLYSGYNKSRLYPACVLHL